MANGKVLWPFQASVPHDVDRGGSNSMNKINALSRALQNA